jgi:hypothetical protein
MKQTDPYTGPFPRKRHSHRCLFCNPPNSTWCYKSKCTQPQRTESCILCRLRERYAAPAPPPPPVEPASPPPDPEPFKLESGAKPSNQLSLF